MVRLLSGPGVARRTTQYGESPLHVAARRNRAAAVRIALASGADPGHTDLRGNTALHLAASRGFKVSVAVAAPTERESPRAAGRQSGPRSGRRGGCLDWPSLAVLRSLCVLSRLATAAQWRVWSAECAEAGAAGQVHAATFGGPPSSSSSSLARTEALVNELPFAAANALSCRSDFWWPSGANPAFLPGGGVAAAGGAGLPRERGQPGGPDGAARGGGERLRGCRQCKNSIARLAAPAARPACIMLSPRHRHHGVDGVDGVNLALALSRVNPPLKNGLRH